MSSKVRSACPQLIALPWLSFRQKSRDCNARCRERSTPRSVDAAASLRFERALLETPNAPDKLLDEAAALEKRKNEILRALRGDQALRARNMNLPPSISRARGRHRRRAAHVNAAADANSNRSIRRRGAEFEQALARLRQLIEGDLAEAGESRWKPRALPGRRGGFRSGRTTSGLRIANCGLRIQG